jgi:hypothetical protein
VDGLTTDRYPHDLQSSVLADFLNRRLPQAMDLLAYAADLISLPSG